MQIDYLWSKDGRCHAINCSYVGASVEIGILCLMAFPEDAIRISNEDHSFLVEVPKEFRSQSERVKVFNATLNVLNHEQV
jgi:hypothetical protein